MLEEEFLRNWEILKPLILAKWPKLHASDLKGKQPIVDELVKVIQEKYPEAPKQSIIEDLENLGQQILKNP